MTEIPVANTTFAIIYFIYGLAFFSMGLAILLEHGRGSDLRLKLALRPLAAFGIIHALHEWMDMLEYAGLEPVGEIPGLVWQGIKISLLAYSFISLAGFGFSSLAPNIRIRRISLLAPLILSAIWGFGLMVFQSRYQTGAALWDVACVWTRYSLGIPSALAASVGLIAQQREFRRAGLAEFGRDSFVAAIAFGWYGIVGQLFTRASRLPPSTYLNEDLFLYWFNFPIQIFRAVMAVIITIYVIRFMRSFDTEIQKQITDLQEARIEEAKRREALRGELLKRVVAAQESERQRIARELHDETGQALTAIGLGLRGASSAIDKNITKAKQNLRQLEAMSASSLDELQRLIANLRPAHLDDLGLVAATRWHTNEVMSHTGLEIQFSVIGKERPLHDTVKIATYRIVQEAITNVIKHADASKVYVEMCFQPNELCLVVSDNGRGMEFKSESELMQRSWGLLGMRERTKLLDGEFHIESAPSKGVKIEVSIPYQLQLTDSLIITENGEEIEVTDDHPSAVSG